MIGRRYEELYGTLSQPARAMQGGRGAFFGRVPFSERWSPRLW